MNTFKLIPFVRPTLIPAVVMTAIAMASCSRTRNRRRSGGSTLFRQHGGHTHPHHRQQLGAGRPPSASA
ncbi:MAG: hypothetical protein LBL24_02805 [Bacteroidales bacterium]|jgi:hypothetical protein|nr:hypothetical protein [Bacteroidales bacterium]